MGTTSVIRSRIERKVLYVEKDNVSKAVETTSEIKKELNVDVLVSSVPTMSSRDGSVPADSEEAKTSTAVNEENNESGLDSSNKEVDETEIQSTSQVASNQSSPADVGQGFVSQIGMLLDLKINANAKVMVMEIKSQIAKKFAVVATKTDHLSDGFALTNTEMDKMQNLTNSKIDNMKDLMVSMTDSIKSAHTKISENITKLTDVSDMVDQNQNKILLTTKKQEELEELINNQIQSPSYVELGVITGSKGI